jgi:hypothetical protein
MFEQLVNRIERLPKADHTGVVHLVSLEGTYKNKPIWSLPEDAAFVGLDSFKIWQFECLTSSIRKHRLRCVHTRSCKVFAELPLRRQRGRRLLPTSRPASGNRIGTAAWT